MNAKQQSFAAIAERHLDDVLAYLVYLTADHTLAEDLTVDTFERALRRWRRFDPRRGSARTWLCQLARSAALDHFRSEARRLRREDRYAVRELRERVLELGGKAFAEARPRHLAQLPHGIALLAAQSTSLRAEVIQRRRASKLAEPGARSTTARVEAVPAPQCALECVDREVFGEGMVGGQVHEIGENVVEVLLGDGGEARRLRFHGLSTTAACAYVTAASTAAS